MTEPIDDDNVIDFVAVTPPSSRRSSRRIIAIIACVAVIAVGGAWALYASTSTANVAAGDGLDGELPDTTTTVVDEAPATTGPEDTTIVPVDDPGFAPTTTLDAIDVIAPGTTTVRSGDETIDATSTVAPPDNTYPPSYDDTYERICVTLHWESGCTAYIVYNEFGEEVNRVVAGDSYTIQEVSELSGGGPNGTAVPFQHWGPPP